MMTISSSPSSLRARTLRIAAMVLIVPIVLTGCSAFEPNYTECPSIKAAVGGEEVATTGTNFGQNVIVRINGYAARCVATANGHSLKLDLGLLLRRDFDAGLAAERVPINVTLAFIDQDNNIVGRHLHQNNAAFADYNDKSRPNVIINTEIPSGTRVVLGLGKMAAGQ